MGITPAYAGKRPCLTCPDWLSRDHPRVCGEKAADFRFFIFVRGSPPRMRGKDADIVPAVKCRRITPAYAGKSYAHNAASVIRKDHPRVCGEKRPFRPSTRQVSGSPPRMRGKGERPEEGRGQVGITPAYAGKSNKSICCTTNQKDHPRVCGEKPAYYKALCLGRGSPPRMRGKGILPPLAFGHVGITPAYAGKRPCAALNRKPCRDHPRVCGEKARTLIVQDEPQGSPPRMRGKVCMATGLRVSDGITPAYAGKSLSCARGLTRARDHPRVCGEKKSHTITSRVCLGSPPRMRGKVISSASEMRKPGITPAYAGKRSAGDMYHTTLKDHPRVCGEKRDCS